MPNADLSTNILDERGSPFLCCPCVPTCGIVGLRNLGHAIGLIGRMSINIAPTTFVWNADGVVRRCSRHTETKWQRQALCRKHYAGSPPRGCSQICNHPLALADNNPTPRDQGRRAQAHLRGPSEDLSLGAV